VRQAGARCRDGAREVAGLAAGEVEADDRGARVARHAGPRAGAGGRGGGGVRPGRQRAGRVRECRLRRQQRLRVRVGAGRRRCGDEEGKQEIVEARRRAQRLSPVISSSLDSKATDTGTSPFVPAPCRLPISCKLMMLDHGTLASLCSKPGTDCNSKQFFFSFSETDQFRRPRCLRSPELRGSDSMAAI
jgi:hypothetical protein